MRTNVDHNKRLSLENLLKKLLLIDGIEYLILFVRELFLSLALSISAPMTDTKKMLNTKTVDNLMENIFCL